MSLQPTNQTRRPRIYGLPSLKISDADVQLIAGDDILVGGASVGHLILQQGFIYAGSDDLRIGGAGEKGNGSHEPSSVLVGHVLDSDGDGWGGNATLGGTLNLSLIDGFLPAKDEEAADELWTELSEQFEDVDFEPV